MLRILRRPAALGLFPLVVLAGAGRALAAQAAPAVPPPPTVEFFGPAEEKVATTSHVVRLGGRDIAYTATVGTIPIRLDNSAIQARMFYVAYTRDGEDPRTRPVAFFYNGGPGSATIWLHMGSFAPKHVRMAEEGFQPAPPFRLQDNDNSLIDVTDMVFVDAMSTGYSRTAPGVNPQQFHGQDGDIRAFGEFVNGWITVHRRWASPKYLMGESYGTIRSAGLAAELQQRHGMELNGIAMISSLLTYQTIRPAPNNDVAFASHVQTYTAAAWYHKKLPADLQSLTLEQVVGQSRTFAWAEYLTALTKANTLSAPERTATANKFARLTGVSAQFVLDANLRVSPERYRKELLRDQRLAIGRLDARYTALDLDAAGEIQEFDPSNTALQGPYTAMFQDYVRNELKWDTELRYLSRGNVRPWTYIQNEYMDMTEPLRGAMTRNPFLRVFVIIGYYDMATTAGGTEFNFSHLAYDKQVTDRVSYGYYEGGHMMYTRPSAHAALRRDLVRFINESKGARAGAQE